MIKNFNSLIFSLFITSILFSCSKEKEVIDLSTPTNLVISKGVYLDKIKLEWELSPEIKNIEIFKYDSISGQYLKISETTENFYFDTVNLETNKKYYYKVRGRNSKTSISEFTNFDFGYIMDYTTLLSNLQADIRSDSVLLSWTEITGTDRYYLYRSCSSNLNFTLYDSIHKSNYKDPNLEPSVTYYYKIVGKRKNCLSSFSNEVNRTVYEDYTSTSIPLEGQYYMRDLAVDGDKNIYTRYGLFLEKLRKYNSDGNFIKEYNNPNDIPFFDVEYMRYFQGNVVVSGLFDYNVIFNTETEAGIKLSRIGNNSHDRPNMISVDKSYVYFGLGDSILKVDGAGNILKRYKFSGYEIGVYSNDEFVPRSSFICRNDTFIISTKNGNSSKITFYNSDGAYIKEILIEGGTIFDIQADLKGFLYLTIWGPDMGMQKKKIDQEGKIYFVRQYFGVCTVVNEFELFMLSNNKLIKYKNTRANY